MPFFKVGSAARGRLGEQRRLVVAAVAVLGAMPLALTLVGTVVVRQFKAEDALRVAVQGSFHHRAVLRDVFTALEDAESAQRGFLLTGEAAYLRPYEAARAAIEPQLRAAADASASDAGERRDAEVISRLARMKMTELARTIGLQRADHGGAALAIVRTGAGLRLMREIRHDIDAGQKTDLARVAAGTAKVAAAARWTVALAIALVGGASVILLAAFYLFVSGFGHLRAAHRRLSEIAIRQGAVLGSAVDPIITLNPSGTVETVNPAGERVFGVEQGAMARRDFANFVRLDRVGSGGFLESIGLGPDTATTSLREGEATRSDGAVFPVEVSFGVMRLDSGRHVVATVRDVSERRAADQMKHEFISSVSHELRTPLTSITGALGLLRGQAAGVLPTPIERLVEIAHSNSERLNRLVDDILDLDKLKSERAPFAKVRFDLHAVFRDAVIELEGYLHKYGVRVALQADAPVWAMGDASRIAQVATNLLSNAGKFSPRGGTVRVAFAVKDDLVQASVHNDGAPIAREFRERIFSRFAQADASDTRSHGGTGLGLAICKEIVDRHEGRIFFKSDAETGTRFFLHLPAAETMAVAAPEPLAEARLRVLICEDDPQVGELLQAVVKAEAGEPDLVYALKQAAAAMRATHYDVALLDLRLPDGDGLDFLRSLPRRDDGPPMPVIVVSADEPRHLDPRLYPVTILDWLEKPIRPGALRGSIRAAFKTVQASRAVARPIILHIDDDPDLGRLVRQLLDATGEVVHAQSLADAKQKLVILEPALVVLDIGLADGSGLSLLPLLVDARGRRIPSIVFSAQIPETPLGESVDVVLTKARASLERLSVEADRLVRRGRDADPARSRAA